MLTAFKALISQIYITVNSLKLVECVFLNGDLFDSGL